VGQYLDVLKPPHCSAKAQPRVDTQTCVAEQEGLVQQPRFSRRRRELVEASRRRRRQSGWIISEMEGPATHGSAISGKRRRGTGCDPTVAAADCRRAEQDSAEHQQCSRRIQMLGKMLPWEKLSQRRDPKTGRQSPVVDFREQSRSSDQERGPLKLGGRKSYWPALDDADAACAPAPAAAGVALTLEQSDLSTCATGRR
jgi:hypothetical protein